MTNDPRIGTWKPDQNNCGYNLVTSSIVGGEDAKVGEFPYMALLGYLYNSKKYYTCAGSVINNWYILTAAHCLNSQLGKPV